MTSADMFPNLGEQDVQIFRHFCDKALASKDLLSSVSIEEVSESPGLSDGKHGALGKSIVVLMDHGYLHRSGRFRYTLTLSGFEQYARAYIENYDDKQNAVKDVVAGVDRTDTNAIVASTGEKKYLVNHVLRMLKSHSDISAFVGTADSVQVTQVSQTFKEAQAARRLLDNV
jgi:hypothetical protein